MPRDYGDRRMNELTPYSRAVVDADKRYDMMILIQNGPLIPAHIDILASRSSVMRSLFQKDKFKRERFLKINGLKVDTARRMLKFMYTNDIPNLDEFNAVELLKAAEKYGMEDLKSICTHYIRNHINMSNVIELLFVADDVNAENIVSTAIRFISANKAKLTMDDFERLSQRCHFMLRLLDMSH